MENNHLIPKELNGCTHANSALCGAEQKLIDKLIEIGVPSYEDIAAKIEVCTQDPSCTQDEENAIRLEGIDVTKEKISDLFAKGELSRQELALLNNQLAADISEYMRQEGNVGEEMSWKEKPYGDLIDENNIKEKIASGLSREEAEFDALIDKTLEMGIASLGGIGGIKGGGKKPGNSNNKDKGKEESGKQGQTADNKTNSGKEGNNSSDSISFPSNDAQVKHIFRDKEGHIKDTPENRKIIAEVGSNKDNYYGRSKWGNNWHAKINSDGSQTWVESRNGVIINAGINKTPRLYDPATGFKASVRPDKR